MKLTNITFEGTPEEFKVAQPWLPVELQGSGATETPRPLAMPVSTPPVPPIPNASEELSEEAAALYLTRRPFTKTQKAVMKGVLKAGDTGITSSELAELIGCDPATVKSAMRSFGKRVAHTDGWPEDLQAFARNWEGTQNRYRHHSAIRALLDSGRVQL